MLSLWKRSKNWLVFLWNRSTKWPASFWGGYINWTRDQQLAAISIVVSLVVSLLAIFVSIVLAVASMGFSYLTRQQTETSRVESGRVTSNSNKGLDPEDQWRRWVASASDLTKYVGLRRRVVFGRKFSGIPRVSAALGLINTFPMSDLLFDLDYKTVFSNRVVPAPPRTGEPSAGQELHVVSFATDIAETGFEVEVGIGLPTKAANFLDIVLAGRQPTWERVNRMVNGGQINDPDAINDRWLANFYELVGTIDVTWTAQQ